MDKRKEYKDATTQYKRNFCIGDILKGGIGSVGQGLMRGEYIQINALYDLYQEDMDRPVMTNQAEVTIINGKQKGKRLQVHLYPGGFSHLHDKLDDQFEKDIQKFDLKIVLDRGDKPANWQPSGIHYKVSLFYDDNGPITFDYWDSAHNKETGKEPNPIDALHCFVSDCQVIDYCEDWGDLFEDFGYDYPREAKRVYNACQKAYNSAHRIGLPLEEIWEYLTEELGM